MAEGRRTADGHIQWDLSANNHNPYHLTSDQMHEAITQFASTPEFQALDDRGKTNAYTDFLNKLTNSDNPGVDPHAGFFQDIPGQPQWETLATRIIGAVGGAVVGGELAFGGAGAAPVAPAAGVDATVDGAGAGGAGAAGAGAGGAGAAGAGGGAAGGGGAAAITHAATSSTLPLVAGQIASAAISGALAPPSFQPREPYTGSADPNAWMGNAHDRISALLDSATAEHNSQPQARVPQLPPGFLPRDTGPQRAPFPTTAPPAFTPTDPNAAAAAPGGNRDQHAARLALLALGGTA